MYFSLGGVTIGRTQSLWDSGSALDYADYATFSWHSSRSRSSRRNDLFIRDTIRYVGEYRNIGFGISIEYLGNIPYQYIRKNDSNFAVVSVFTLRTEWGGSWIKIAYDSPLVELAAKGGIHWNLPETGSALRVLLGWSGRSTIFGEHHFGPWNPAGKWSVIGSYVHYFSSEVWGATSIGAFEGRSDTILASEISFIWNPSVNAELRAEVSHYSDLEGNQSGLFGSLRLTRFF